MSVTIPFIEGCFIISHDATIHPMRHRNSPRPDGAGQDGRGRRSDGGAPQAVARTGGLLLLTLGLLISHNEVGGPLEVLPAGHRSHPPVRALTRDQSRGNPDPGFWLHLDGLLYLAVWPAHQDYAPARLRSVFLGCFDGFLHGREGLLAAIRVVDRNCRGTSHS